MDVTPQELRGSEIKEAWRGYHRDEVDDLLERAAVAIEHLSQQLATAGSRPTTEPGPIQVGRDDAEMLQRTLILAQRAADDAVSEAHEQARKLVEESEARAQTLVGEAEATARRIAESERRRLEFEIQDLASRRDLLKVDADALEEYAHAYRDRVRAAIEADLASFGAGAIDAPLPRPELHDVDVPPVAAIAEPELGREPDAGTDTRAITIDAPNAAAEFAAEPAPSSATPRLDAPEWPPPAPEATSVANSGTASTGGWLDGNDEWATSDSAFDDGLPWDQATAAHEPFASDVAMEATAVEGDGLDDDAFFASLRDAVREDQPLGPRDDAELDDERRRFRRRR